MGRLSRVALALALLSGCDKDEDPVPVPDDVVDAVDAEEATETDDPPADLEDVEDAEVGWSESGPGLGLDYDEEPAGGTPRFEPDADDWLAVGWPTDRLRGPDGHPDLSVFPDVGSELLAVYLEEGEKALDGYGLNGAVYFQLDIPVDVARLPGPADTTDPLSVVQLVNVTPASAEYGARRPLEFRGYGVGLDPFYGPNTLALRPVSGFPLTEGETWCAVLTRGARDVTGAVLQQPDAFGTALFEAPDLAPLLAWLDDSPLHSVDIASATCFTTHRPTEELAAVVAYLDQAPLPEVTLYTEPRVFDELHGTYEAPSFQAGDKPYEEAGGYIELDADGVPVVQSLETIRFMVLLPRGHEMPEAGWPVVTYAHGTGGDYESCRGAAGDLNAIGLAVVCIDQPLHGSRGPEGLEEPLDNTALVTLSFNFLNPLAGRSNFRQAAIDSMVLGRLLKGGALDRPEGETLTGQPIRFDPDRIYFFGHSHGGLSGALLLGVDPLFAAGVLSGAAGGLVHTILLRKDPLDIAELIRAIVLVSKEDFDVFHPMLTLVQMMVDATDPLNYASRWQEFDRPIYVTEGTSDHASPAVATDHMGAAAGLPLIGPLAKTSPAHELRGMETLDKPVSGSGALEQWQDGTHWVAFDDSEARATWVHFFRSLVEEGPPVLDTGPFEAATAAPQSAGDTCDDAPDLIADARVVRVRGTTAHLQDDYADCVSGEGAGRRDGVYRFTPAVSGTWRVRLTVPPKLDKDDPPTGPDRLFVTTDCALEDACLGSGTDQWLDLVAGGAVYLVVDGTSVDHVGPFLLELERVCVVEECGERECGLAGCTDCGTCEGQWCSDAGECVPPVAGDVCADALTAEGLPVAVVGSTTGALHDYGYAKGECAGYSGGFGGAAPDVVWNWTAPSDGRFTFRLDATFDASLSVWTDCNDVCLGAERRGSTGERVDVDLVGGQTVRVVVDGASKAWHHGEYTLRIEACVSDCTDKPCGGDGCGGTCGDCEWDHRCIDEPKCDPIPYLCTPHAECEAILEGDTCALAHVVDALPWTFGGSTQELEDERSASGCPGFGGGGNSPEAFHVFTAESEGLYRFHVAADWDTRLYVLDGDCGACTHGANKDKKSNEVIFVPMVAGETVYAVVDGNSKSSHKGDYTLKVSLCVPNCDSKECGSDGCGGSCGGCIATQTCAANACGPRDTDECDTAPDVAAKKPWSKTITMSQHTAGDDVACGTPIEAGETDAWYRLDDKGTWIVSTNGGTLDVLDGCGSECVATGESVEVTVGGDEGPPAVWLRLVGTGAPKVTVAAKCVPDCEGKNCGDDGCGGSCGACDAPLDVCDEGTCADPAAFEGNGCASPIAVEAPFSEARDLSQARNSFLLPGGACAGWQAKGGATADEVFRIEAPGTYRITVTPLSIPKLDLAVWAMTDCLGSCVQVGDAWERDTMLVTSDGPLWVVVDGASNRHAFEDEAPYTIEVEALSE